MFTGLVQEVGKVKALQLTDKSAVISIAAKSIIEDLKIGDSIATNGVCLTVTSFKNDQFTVDVMAETVRKTNLRYLNVGDLVNLEPALRVSDRLGGHIVSGHIDGVGTIKSYNKEDNAVWITVTAKPEILKYIISKGSIAIDGVSLTVAFVDEREFKVSIIPHTQTVTTLLSKHSGELVNLECDIIGKYIEKLMVKKDQKQQIDINFLNDNGFL